MTTPENQDRLRALIDGYRQTALLYAAAKLGVTELLADGASDAQQLAGELEVEPGALHRLLRGLAALEIVREEPDGRFSLTELGSGLRRGGAGSLREWAILAGEEYLPAWGALPHSIRSGQAAFDHVFGMTPWEHRRHNPELDACFNSWLREQTATAARSILQACDFAHARVVADIGGGHGALLAAILSAHPGLEGILIDLPHVVAEAGPALERAGVAERCRTQGGDFFVEVPGEADVYLLKSVLHDWDDGRCTQILRTCRRAMSPSARLLVIERVLSTRALDDPATVMLDLHMLAVLGGRERSSEDYRAIASSAGLELRRILPTTAGFHVMEFAPGERSP